MGIVEATVTNKGKKGLIRRFAPYFKKYLWILIFDLFCAALTTVCELALPIIVQQITNRGINDLASLTLSYILRIGGLYIFLKLVDVGATFFMASIGHIMGTKIETDMRRDMFAHLQKLSFSYFDNTKIGQLMSRITTDLFDITEFAHHCPEEFFIAGIKIIGAFVILCTMSVPLTLIIFAVLPFMLAAAMFFNKRMQAQFRSQRQQLGEINAQVEDSLLGVRVVKSFANEPLEEKKFEEGNQRFYNIKRLRYMYMGGFEASNKFFDGLMYIVVVIAGAIFMMNGAITLGTMDGANVEIVERVGFENAEIFGLRVEDVDHFKQENSYNVWQYYDTHYEIKRVVDTLTDGTFSADPQDFRIIYNELMFKNDEFFVLADFNAYREAQERVERRYQDKQGWARMCLVNIAKSGFFSSDRTIQQYADEIWHINPIDVK